MGWQKRGCQASSPFQARARPAKLIPTQRKGSQMHSVVCGIDESGSHEAVIAAVNYCRENGASLRLVGIVKDRLGDSTRATAGERVRRSKAVSLELNRGGAGSSSRCTRQHHPQRWQSADRIASRGRRN